MKIGIHAGLWMKAWTDDPVPILKMAAEIGYDGVELSLSGIDPDRVPAIRTGAGACGLHLTCPTGLGPDADPASEDLSIRDHAVAVPGEAIHVTARPGSHSLAGVVAAPRGVVDPANKAARTVRPAGTLARLDGVPDAEGVIPGIETLNRFEGDLTSTAAGACAIARATGSGHIGVLPDSFQMSRFSVSPWCRRMAMWSWRSGRNGRAVRGWPCCRRVCRDSGPEISAGA